jgi:hypothetical protein
LKSSRKTIIAVFIIIVAIGAFLLLSVIPYSTGGNPDEAFLGIRANATVSPSYVILQCGLVYNPTISTTLGTVHSQHSVWSGVRWTCGTSWTQTSPS